MMEEAVFKDVHAVLGRCCQKLHSQRVSATKRHSERMKNEEHLWETETLGVDSPLALQYAVFLYNVLNFVLCGGKEHRKLKSSQLKFSIQTKILERI